MPVDNGYAYDETFVSIEPVPKEYIEIDDTVNFELLLRKKITETAS